MNVLTVFRPLALIAVQGYPDFSTGALLLVVLFLAGCSTIEEPSRHWSSSPHPALIKLCLSDEVIANVNGEQKYWRDTLQCQDAMSHFNGH